MTPEQFLDAALGHVESKSIRAWATGVENKPIILGMATRWLERGRIDPERFATYLMMLAMGL